MATKTLSLNISERIAGLSILNAFKGNLDKLAIILDDIKGFAVEDAEWEKAERKVTPANDGTGNDRWNWSDDKGGKKEITIHSETTDYLRQTIKERNDKGEFTLQDKSFITLQALLA